MSERRVLMAIFLLAVFLRIGGNAVKQEAFFHEPFLLFGNEYCKNVISDSTWYHGAAVAFMKGKGLVSIENTPHVDITNAPLWFDRKKIDGNYYAHRLTPPLYPLFLALCYRIGGINTLSYFIPQVILGLLTCLFVYFLAKEIFNEKVAGIAGFAMAVYPDLIFWTYLVRVETLFIFFLCLGFLLFVMGKSRGKKSLIYISAAVFGLASLTRVTFIPFIPLLFLWAIFCLKEHKKENFKSAVIMVMIIFSVLLPWIMRNYFVFGKLSPFTAEINIMITRGTDNNSKESSEITLYRSKHGSFVSSVIASISDHKSEYFLSSLKRFVVFWSPYTAPMRGMAKIYKAVTWIIIFPAAFFGILHLRKYWAKSGILVIFILYYSLMHAASFVDGGLVYRYPIQPFLCIFAAYGFYAAYGKIRRTV